MSFMSIVALCSIFYFIIQVVGGFRADLGKNVTVRQIAIILVYVGFLLASPFMGKYSILLVIANSFIGASIMRQYAIIPNNIK